MATIYLDATHRLQSDSRQWALQRKVTSKDDKATWSPFRYYSTLKGAAKGAHSYFLNTSDAVGIDELVKRSDEILDMLTDALTPTIET